MKKFVSTMMNGALFVFPLGLLMIVSVKLFISLEHLIRPLADGIGVQRLLGKFTLTIFSVALILFFCFVLGLLLQRATILNRVSDAIEGVVVRFIPSLGFLKSMADEKFDVETEDAWVGILFEDEGSWVPAFLIEESPQWVTIFFAEAPKGDGGEVRVFAREKVNFRQVDLSVVRSSLRVYGAGLIDEIQTH